MCYNKTITIFNALVKVFIRDKHNCVFGYDWQTLKASTLDMFFRNVLNGEEVLEWGRQHTNESMPLSDNCGELVLTRLLSTTGDDTFVKSISNHSTYYFFIDLVNDLVTYGFCVNNHGFIGKRDKGVFLCTFVSDRFFNAVGTFRTHVANGDPEVVRDFFTQLLLN